MKKNYLNSSVRQAVDSFLKKIKCHYNYLNATITKTKE